METLEKFKADYNWRQAFYQAQGDGYQSSYSESDPVPCLIDKVVEIIASSEGEGSGPDWICLVQVEDDKPGQLVKVFAGCDYTGWD